jgi:succinyl-CoA synthetase beta subunit
MKCDIIAGALIGAFQEIKPKVPFVVRLEGTNVEKGRQMLTASGLNITTADGMADAAKKVVAAAR